MDPLGRDGGMQILGAIHIWVFPKIGGFPPKWMVKIMENPMKMDDLGVFLFFGNIQRYVCI